MPRVNQAGKVGNYADALTRELRAPIKVQMARGRTGVDRTSAANVVIAIPCASGHAVTIGYNQMFPPEVVRKKMTQAGWDFHHGALCPECAEKARAEKRRKPDLKLVPSAPPVEQDLVPKPTPEPKEVPMQTPTTQTSPLAVAAASANPSPSAKAKAARRAVMQWLNESFELTGAEKGRYKAGITDASIAKETGCAKSAVKQIREEFFGVIDRPKELDTISAEVGSLLLAADSLEKAAIAAAAKMVENAKGEARVIRDKAQKLTERLAQISREQGWS